MSKAFLLLASETDKRKLLRFLVFCAFWVFAVNDWAIQVCYFSCETS